VIDLSTETLELHGRGSGLPRTKNSLPLPGDFTGVAFAAEGTFLGSRQGVIRIDPKGGVQVFTENDGLASEVIRDILETRDGRVWVATGSGLGFFEDKIWRFSQERGPMSSSITSLALEQDGTLWFGGETGVHRLKGDNVTSWDDGDGLFSRSVLGLTVGPNGQVWALHESGLSIVTPGR